MKSRLIHGAAVVLGCLAWGAQAHAGGLHDDASIALSGERLATLSYTSISGDVDEDEGTIALFGRTASLSPFDLPRLAVDAFVIPGLSIGGSLSYQMYFLDPQEVTVFTLQPRVGYAVGMGDSADFWLKGGLSYYSTTTSGSGLIGDITDSGLAFSAAFDFAIGLAPHFSLLVGPSIDVGLFGERSAGATDIDVKYTTLGLNVGLLGWL